MEISDLPVWADVFPGESVRSWLDATRVRLGLVQEDWWTWCGIDPTEPERPAHKKCWSGLPPALGQISDIPVDLRIAPVWREIYCPHCVVEHKAGIRHPVLTKWLDVRSISCDEHRLLLSYRSLSRCVNILDDPELEAWDRWLREWRDDRNLDVLEHRFRRDLLLAASRNWSPSWALIAGVGSNWLLTEKGWLARSLPSNLHPPNGPSRVGTLGPSDRMSALFSAWRAWIAMREGVPAALPRWPLEAWQWLEARWRTRVHYECGMQFAGIASALARRQSRDLRRQPRRTSSVKKRDR